MSAERRWPEIQGQAGLDEPEFADQHGFPQVDTYAELFGVVRDLVRESSPAIVQ